jgi:hypothetical protein
MEATVPLASAGPGAATAEAGRQDEGRGEEERRRSDRAGCHCRLNTPRLASCQR